MNRSRVGRVVAALAAAVVAVVGGVPASASAQVADTSAPVLRSLSLSPASVQAPGSIVATLDAVDDVAVTRASVRFLEDSSRRWVDAQSGAAPLTVGGYFPQTAANGTWRAYDVTLWDEAGNYARYRADGTMYTSRTGSGTHTVDLTTPSATLSRASDRTPPVLTSLTRGATGARAGEPTTWSWSARDDASDLATIEATFRHVQSTQSFSTGVLPAFPGSGSWTLSAPIAGEWRLDTVAVTDSRGNVATYRADGRIDMANALMPRRHELPFSSLGVAVAPAAFTPTVVGRPGGLTLVLPESVGRSALSSVRVVVSPAGIVRDVPMSASAPLAIDISPLPPRVRQTLSVTLRSRWGDSPVATVSAQPVLTRNLTR